MTYEVDGIVATSPKHRKNNLDDWREWSFNVHGRGSLNSDDGGFRGRVSRQASDAYQLVGWKSSSHVYTRTARDIRADARDHYTVVMPVAGSVYVGLEHPRAVRAGALLVLPPCTPFQVAHSTMAAGLALLVPPSRFEARVPSRLPSGRMVSSSSGVGRVAGDTLGSMHREREALIGSDFDTLADRALDFVLLALAGETPAPDEAVGALMTAIRGYVQEHVADPGLSLNEIARAVGWSGRYIQLVLAKQGTSLRELIRSERLELARVRLARDSGRQSISAVAASVGYSSPSAFSNAYRKHFGYTPREARHRGAE